MEACLSKSSRKIFLQKSRIYLLASNWLSIPKIATWNQQYIIYKNEREMKAGEILSPSNIQSLLELGMNFETAKTSCTDREFTEDWSQEHL